MINYKLLTPGPLTTTDSVKREMMNDHCTWDRDYKNITQNIRKELLSLARVSENEYTVVLMQGSGTFGVESVLTSVVGEGEKLLIISNGSYGERMVQIAEYSGLEHRNLSFGYDAIPNCDDIAAVLDEDEDITHVAVVHCETTSGILNDIEVISKIVKKKGKSLIVDAMSSFGGIDIDLSKLDIDYMISSSNKCIQGVPGFSFIICKKKELDKCNGKARSLSLDLYGQWKEMDKDGKWRFTSPTHVVLAFARALKELKLEGGIAVREKRYRENNKLLRERMENIGIKSYVKEEYQSPIITTFLYPERYDFSFEKMYNYIKERGYAIYPGKLTDIDTFRVGNIGEIYREDIERLSDILEGYINE